jgi:hypothetical protein
MAEEKQVKPAPPPPSQETPEQLRERLIRQAGAEQLADLDRRHK